MNPVEGKIEIDLYPGKTDKANSSKTSVEIKSSRPLHASRMFVGKTPEHTLSLIPLLFNICGIAQSRSALASIQQSMKKETIPELETARDILVLVENAKEHLMRIFLDWPRLFELNNNNKNLPFLSQLIPNFKSALFANGEAFQLDSTLDLNSDSIAILIEKLEKYLETNVFCQSPDSWLKIENIDSVQKWSQNCNSIAAQTIDRICVQGWASQGFTDCEQLPELDNEGLLQSFSSIDSDDFIAKPKWQGNCYETTSLTRQIGHPLIQSIYKEFHATLITRWIARLVELAGIPQRLRILLKQISKPDSCINNENNFVGLAAVEAARGRLIHRVEIKDNTICNYQILAPTEWNFHPEGLIAQSLSSLSGKNNQEIKKIAEIMINAIDPCVGYELRIH